MELKDTVHLPKTDFPMRASLAEREPLQVAAWEEQRIYEQLLEANRGHERFILHDGPPYANGPLHQGHFLDKILKDMVVKFQAMSGKLAPYVPGWDCHGLPIEMQLDKQLGKKKREMSASDFRRACRKYAEEQVEIQRKGFRRLGVLGAWSDPYLTMNFGYEAQTVRVLAEVCRRGVLYRRKKPVYWCSRDATALAEAEVEYADRVSPSIYVGFTVTDAAPLLKAAPKLAGQPLQLAIWTTTPWTIPANLAVTAGPELTYVAYQLADRTVIVAQALLGDFLRACAPGELAEGAAAAGLSLEHPERVLATFRGEELASVRYRHPLIATREGPVVLGEHATTEAGTGLVHTAPGHGEDDFRMGLANGLPILAPVDSHGRYTDEVGIEGLAGVQVFEANPQIVERLAAAGALLNKTGQAFDYSHSYPHCWRCKQPLIFRATDQWWIGLDLEADLGGTRQTIRSAALAAIDQIFARGGFIPSWGRDRLRGMVENRPDWCISRQRSWGVPIPVAYCAKDREPLVSAEAMERVAGFFDKEGADAWFDRPLSELLPEGSRCAKCGGTEFEKETDILDVWFDSGSSFAAVCAQGRWPDLRVPVELYLEGSDQHRGWFMSSLMLGIATRGQAPYKAVLTHGFVVDGEGRKMSKSLGNAPDPEALLKKYGAEVMRLWVAASDYREDVRLSIPILDQLAEGYRKIRNTLRYCLSQLSDFDPAKDAVPLDQLEAIDRWALSRFERYRQAVMKSYETFEFHRIYHATVELCATDLSSFYFDTLKDRTYCSGKTWPARRAAQTVLHRICRDLCRLLAPLATFTAEEAWQHLPAPRTPSVLLAGLPQPMVGLVNDGLEAEMAQLLGVRKLVNEALEAQRVAKTLGKASEADLVLRVAKGDPGGDAAAVEAAARLAALRKHEALLPELLLTATVRVEERTTPGPDEAQVAKSPHRACERCWRALAEVGSLTTHPSLCARCARAVSEVAA